MAVLYFTGQQVAFFSAIASAGGASTFTGVRNPFLPSDVIEIEVRDRDIKRSGEFRKDKVQFTRITVIRGGVRHDFPVAAGSRIADGGGGSKAQGDTFFTTRDPVQPPATGPFAGVAPGRLAFAAANTFATGQTTTILRQQDLDLNGDGRIKGAGEKGNGRFNARQVGQPVCLAAGTPVLTPAGPRAVESLRPGDLVCTAPPDPSVLRVLWVGSQRRRFTPGDAHPHRPVRIRAGALGPGVPAADLVLSPQHGVRAGFGQLAPAARTGPAFIRAKALLGLPGVTRMRGCREVTYVAVLLERHASMLAAGAAVESFYPGPIALAALGPAERAALAARHPGLLGSGRPGYGAPAHPYLALAEARRRLGLAPEPRGKHRREAPRDTQPEPAPPPGRPAPPPRRGGAAAPAPAF